MNRLTSDSQGSRSSHEDGIIGSSRALRQALALADTVAPVNSTVLIQGETGTGKELVAQAIHRQSSRSERPFIRLNCAAIPLGLLESELFGHERGAFTGAVIRRLGRFELANRGSLFLDEVGDIHIELQAKLLRVLQEGEFERLGGSQTLTSDVRLIAATHRNLAKLVSDGQFRSDLYYRLSVFPIIVPPLRERPEDIPLLVEHYVRKFADAMGKTIREVPTRAMEIMREYAWPGNIRELRNFIERSVIVSSGPQLLPPVEELEAAPKMIAACPVTMKDAEYKHICQILTQSKWVIAGPSGAAARLGMKRSTLYFRMKRFGITRPLEFRTH